MISKIGQKINEIFNTPDLVFEDIFLGQFVEKRIEAIKPHIARRNIHLITRLKASSPILIPAEPLRKTVGGLIRNAIENTPDGGKIEPGPSKRQRHGIHRQRPWDRTDRGGPEKNL